MSKKATLTLVLIISAPVAVVLLILMFMGLFNLSNILNAYIFSYILECVYPGVFYLVPVVIILVADSYYKIHFSPGLRIVLTLATVFSGVISILFGTFFAERMINGSNEFNRFISIISGNYSLDWKMGFIIRSEIFHVFLLRRVWFIFWSAVFITLKELAAIFSEQRKKYAVITFIVLSFAVLAFNPVLTGISFSEGQGNIMVALSAAGMAVAILSALVGQFLGRAGKRLLVFAWLPFVAASEFLAFAPISGDKPWFTEPLMIIIFAVAAVAIYIPCPVACMISCAKRNNQLPV